MRKLGLRKVRCFDQVAEPGLGSSAQNYALGKNQDHGDWQALRDHYTREEALGSSSVLVC